MPTHHPGGCTFAADPAEDCIRAAYMWTADADPCVLRARLLPSDGDGMEFDLSRWPHCVVGGDAFTHVRLHLPDGVLRLDFAGEVILTRPAAIEPAIDLRRAIEPQIATLRRIESLVRGSLFARSDQRFVRLVEALRVADALAAGASLRDIGLGVFGGEWPGDGEHLKSRVRRRVSLAAELMRVGPHGVLRHRI